jgi:predicted DNA-binding transcriptional regulator YafY
LVIEFDYGGKPRVAEPYSLRQASTGNILLYAWEQATAQMKAFSVAKIKNLRPTPRAFTPRYRVEFAEETTPATPPAREQ